MIKKKTILLSIIGLCFLSSCSIPLIEHRYDKYSPSFVVHENYLEVYLDYLDNYQNREFSNMEILKHGVFENYRLAYIKLCNPSHKTNSHYLIKIVGLTTDTTEISTYQNDRN